MLVRHPLRETTWGADDLDRLATPKKENILFISRARANLFENVAPATRLLNHEPKDGKRKGRVFDSATRASATKRPWSQLAVVIHYGYPGFSKGQISRHLDSAGGAFGDILRAVCAGGVGGRAGEVCPILDVAAGGVRGMAIWLYVDDSEVIP